MTIGTVFYSWQKHQPADDPRYNRCSPNLVALGFELDRRFQTSNLGCYGERPIVGGTLPSSHSHGAATDRRYAIIGRARALSELVPYLIDNSHELHLQAIHDYFGSRIWRAGRTKNTADAHSKWWLPQPVSTVTGMGQSWAVYFHLETTRDGWGDGSAIASRLVVVGPPVPIPAPPSNGGKFMHTTVRLTDPRTVSADVYGAQVVLRLKGGAPNLVADGVFGPQTDNAVRDYQGHRGLFVDGVIGPNTWAALDRDANS